MKTDILLQLGLCALSLTAAAAAPATHNGIQHPLTSNKIITIHGPNLSSKQRIPGHNDAFYGPVPKDEQIFRIELLEIAPSPILVNKYFFILLRGEIPRSTRQDLHLQPADLADATLSITGSAVLEKDGEEIEPQRYTIPLRTAELGTEGEAHLAIRNATGAYVDHLALEGRNDILFDYWIPGPFVVTGKYTFEIEASLWRKGKGKGEDRRICLFALTLTQRLEGEEWPW
ncbi:hypothetical protein B0H63DRAFT_102762 [Podospora didyma]|uniref:Uncharacterized protein n=1 Tax=Podospora didyma TaxID=330526 RepID=A0AAE0NXS0_9PEZI|nr:hypothetical protein B0H63DRAFT_102762 [Podospora didyma]